MFGKKTVNDVLASFQKTVQDLRDIGTREQAAIVANDDKIAVLREAIAASQVERNRANAIADKLAALIS